MAYLTAHAAANETRKLLLVDDEEKLLDSMAQRLKLIGFDSIKTKSGHEAVEAAKKNRLDLAIVDLKMPGMDGLATIAKLKEIQPGLKTVLLTGYGEEKVRQAAQALDSAFFEKDEMGRVWDFIKKVNRDRNVVVIWPPGAEASESSGGGLIEILPEKSSSARRFRLIGETPAMRKLRKDIERSAPLDCNVIIRGETGTGKELVARAIHDLSFRKDKPFLAINCGCLTNELLFEGLFGDENGRTARAKEPKGELTGVKFGGTLLLDQIEDMPQQMQLQLLKVIDDNVAPGIGATRRFATDIRIIAAAHSDLKRLADEKKFRTDLLYRLNVMELFIPPLRERGDDIPPLAAYFLGMFAREFKKEVETISEDVISAFMSYNFPGNVRELKHIIERAVVVADGNSVERKHLPERFQKAVDAASAALKVEKTEDDYPSLAEMEAKYIIEVLDVCGGVKTKTAEVLGISRTALWRKLKKNKKKQQGE